MALEGVPRMSKPSIKNDTNDRGRFSAKRKSEAVLRLLRGEDLDAGTSAMKSRPADDRDELVARLQAKVGQLTMDNELLGQKCQHLEAGRPFVTRRRSG